MGTIMNDLLVIVLSCVVWRTKPTWRPGVAGVWIYSGIGSLKELPRYVADGSMTGMFSAVCWIAVGVVFSFWFAKEVVGKLRQRRSSADDEAWVKVDIADGEISGFTHTANGFVAHISAEDAHFTEFGPDGVTSGVVSDCTAPFFLKSRDSEKLRRARLVLEEAQASGERVTCSIEYTRTATGCVPEHGKLTIGTVGYSY